MEVELTHAEILQAAEDDDWYPVHRYQPPPLEPDDSIAVCRAFAVTICLGAALWIAGVAVVGWLFGWWR